MMQGAEHAAGHEHDGGEQHVGLVAALRMLPGALLARSRPSRVNRKAITAVAKTSKKPSTHRCTTHQRQYSTMESEVCSFQSRPAP